MDQVWDPRGEADAALARIVAGFGPQVLGQADLLEGLLQDDIPLLPREAALLTAAARSGVADLLAERVRHGVSAQAAVSMVAADITARTAVDASGAPWAAAAFARVLGYPVTGPATRPVTPPTVPIDQPPPVPAQPTVVMPSRPNAGLPPGSTPATDKETILPAQDHALTVRPAAGGGRNLVTAAAGAAAIVAPMQLLWCADASSHGVLAESFFSATDFWLSAVVLLTGFAGIALWSARSARGGIGFAAVAGVALPTVTTGITSTALAAELTSLPGIIRELLTLISVLWLAAALVAAALGFAGLARSHLLVRCKPGTLPALLAVAGVGYALANILAQGKDNGTLLFNALGSGVKGWWIVWGLTFIVLSSVPPLLAAFGLPAPGARVAMWTGWLLFALANQIGASPINGITAEPGFYLTWFLWIAVLAGTLVMAARGRAAAAGQRAAAV